MSTVPVQAIRSGFRVSPYVPGARGSAVATFLAGHGPLGAAKPLPEMRFIEASGLEFNTLFPGDYGRAGLPGSRSTDCGTVSSRS